MGVSYFKTLPRRATFTSVPSRLQVEENRRVPRVVPMDRPILRQEVVHPMVRQVEEDHQVLRVVPMDRPNPRQEGDPSHRQVVVLPMVHQMGSHTRCRAKEG